MKHTFIAWDACYRNFFHLIGALASQEYPKTEYELIYVEQRDQRSSDEFNHRLGLNSLQDTVNQYRGMFDVKTLFLGADGPYHLGRCNNAGIRCAKGEIVSVMDGDLLLKKDFIRKLDHAHFELGTVINLCRRYARRPVGVELDQWTRGVIDFELCLKECPGADEPPTRWTKNKGPLISAPREWWERVGGYDEHRIWSTGVTRLGQDVTKRMEILVGRESLALPGEVCVHPYHPSGFNRKADVQTLILDGHQQLIDWSVQHHEISHEKRKAYADEMYSVVSSAVESNIAES